MIFFIDLPFHGRDLISDYEGSSHCFLIHQFPPGLAKDFLSSLITRRIALAKVHITSLLKDT